MQKDFSAMAQGQQQSKEQPNQEFTAEEQEGLKGFAKTVPTMKQMGAAGFPTGESREEMKQRILMFLEQLGLMEMFDTPAKQQELAANLEALIDAYEAEDIEAAEANPITQLITEVGAGRQQGEAMAQAAPQQGPTDFAGMVKPPGGGMSGR